MDQSESLQGTDELWLAKLAMLGVTVDKYQDFYFLYVDGRIKTCGARLNSLAPEMIKNIQKGLYT